MSIIFKTSYHKAPIQTQEHQTQNIQNEHLDKKRNIIQNGFNPICQIPKLDLTKGHDTSAPGELTLKIIYSKK